MNTRRLLIRSWIIFIEAADLRAGEALDRNRARLGTDNLFAANGSSHFVTFLRRRAVHPNGRRRPRQSRRELLRECLILGECINRGEPLLVQIYGAVLLTSTRDGTHLG